MASLEMSEASSSREVTWQLFLSPMGCRASCSPLLFPLLTTNRLEGGLDGQRGCSQSHDKRT